jgi:hypothetical protein
MELLPSLSEWMSQSFSDLVDRSPQKSLPQVSGDSPMREQVRPSTKEDYVSVMDPNKPSDGRTMTQEALDWIKELGKDIQDPKKVIQFLSGMAIDPTTYLPQFKIAAAGLGAKAALIGAFRPTESKLLPSTIVELKNRINSTYDEGKRIPLSEKLSDKEITKYGTPEFLLDKYLPSTEQGGSPVWLNAEELKLSQFLEEYDVSRLRQKSEYMAKSVTFKNKSDFGDAQFRLKEHLRATPSLEPNIRAFRDQITDGKPIYITDSLHRLGSAGDIETALKTVNSLVSKSAYTPEQLSKKSLKQLLGIADEEKKKSQVGIAAITDFTKQRTAQLKSTQGLKNDLVELTNKNDFGAETEFLKHCVGAGSINAEGEFLPKWHPITGADLTGDKNLRNSAEIYWGLKERGSSRYFSYRPEGLPVATVELTKDGTVKQLYGFKNTIPKPEDEAKIMDGLKPIIKEIKFGTPDNRKYVKVPDGNMLQAEENAFDINFLLRNRRLGAVENAAMDRLGGRLREWIPE